MVLQKRKRQQRPAVVIPSISSARRNSAGGNISWAAHASLFHGRVFPLFDRVQANYGLVVSCTSMIVEFLQHLAFVLNPHLPGSKIAWSIVYFSQLPLWDGTYCVGMSYKQFLGPFWVVATFVILSLAIVIVGLTRFYSVSMHIVNYGWRHIFHFFTTVFFIPTTQFFLSAVVCSSRSPESVAVGEPTVWLYPTQKCNTALHRGHMGVAISLLVFWAGLTLCVSVACLPFDCDSPSVRRRQNPTVDTAAWLYKVGLCICFQILLARDMAALHTFLTAISSVALGFMYGFVLPYYSRPVNRAMVTMQAVVFWCATTQFIAVRLHRDDFSNTPTYYVILVFPGLVVMAVAFWLSKLRYNPQTDKLFQCCYAMGTMPLVENPFVAAALQGNSEVLPFPKRLPRTDIALSPYRKIEADFVDEATSFEEAEKEASLGTTVESKRWSSSSLSGSSGVSTPTGASDNMQHGSGGVGGHSKNSTSSTSFRAAQSAYDDACLTRMQIVSPTLSTVWIPTDGEASCRFLREWVHLMCVEPTPQMIGFACRILARNMLKFPYSTYARISFAMFLCEYGASYGRMALVFDLIQQTETEMDYLLSDRYQCYQLQSLIQRMLGLRNWHDENMFRSVRAAHRHMLMMASGLWRTLQEDFKGNRHTPFALRLHYHIRMYTRSMDRSTDLYLKMLNETPTDDAFLRSMGDYCKQALHNDVAAESCASVASFFYQQRRAQMARTFEKDAEAMLENIFAAEAGNITDSEEVDSSGDGPEELSASVLGSSNISSHMWSASVSGDGFSSLLANSSAGVSSYRRTSQSRQRYSFNLAITAAQHIARTVQMQNAKLRKHLPAMSIKVTFGLMLLALAVAIAVNAVVLSVLHFEWLDVNRQLQMFSRELAAIQWMGVQALRVQRMLAEHSVFSTETEGVIQRNITFLRALASEVEATHNYLTVYVDNSVTLGNAFLVKTSVSSFFRLYATTGSYVHIAHTFASAVPFLLSSARSLADFLQELPPGAEVLENNYYQELTYNILDCFAQLANETEMKVSEAVASRYARHLIIAGVLMGVTIVIAIAIVFVVLWRYRRWTTALQSELHLFQIIPHDVLKRLVQSSNATFAEFLKMEKLMVKRGMLAASPAEQESDVPEVLSASSHSSAGLHALRGMGYISTLPVSPQHFQEQVPTQAEESLESSKRLLSKVIGSKHDIEVFAESANAEPTEGSATVENVDTDDKKSPLDGKPPNAGKSTTALPLGDTSTIAAGLASAGAAPGKDALEKDVEASKSMGKSPKKSGKGNAERGAAERGGQRRYSVLYMVDSGSSEELDEEPEARRRRIRKQRKVRRHRRRESLLETFDGGNSMHGLARAENYGRIGESSTHSDDSERNYDTDGVDGESSDGSDSSGSNSGSASSDGGRYSSGSDSSRSRRRQRSRNAARTNRGSYRGLSSVASSKRFNEMSKTSVVALLVALFFALCVGIVLVALIFNDRDAVTKNVQSFNDHSVCLTQVNDGMLLTIAAAGMFLRTRAASQYFLYINYLNTLDTAILYCRSKITSNAYLVALEQFIRNTRIACALMNHNVVDASDDVEEASRTYASLLNMTWKPLERRMDLLEMYTPFMYASEKDVWAPYSTSEHDIALSPDERTALAMDIVWGKFGRTVLRAYMTHLLSMIDKRAVSLTMASGSSAEDPTISSAKAVMQSTIRYSGACVGIFTIVALLASCFVLLWEGTRVATVLGILIAMTAVTNAILSGVVIAKIKNYQKVIVDAAVVLQYSYSSSTSLSMLITNGCAFVDSGDTLALISYLNLSTPISFAQLSDMLPLQSMSEAHRFVLMDTARKYIYDRGIFMRSMKIAITLTVSALGMDATQFGNVLTSVEWNTALDPATYTYDIMYPNDIVCTNNTYDMALPPAGKRRIAQGIVGSGRVNAQLLKSVVSRTLVDASVKKGSRDVVNTNVSLYSSAVTALLSVMIANVAFVFLLFVSMGCVAVFKSTTTRVENVLYHAIFARNGTLSVALIMGIALISAIGSILSIVFTMRSYSETAVVLIQGRLGNMWSEVTLLAEAMASAEDLVLYRIFKTRLDVRNTAINALMGEGYMATPSAGNIRRAQEKYLFGSNEFYVDSLRSTRITSNVPTCADPTVPITGDLAALIVGYFDYLRVSLSVASVPLDDVVTAASFTEAIKYYLDLFASKDGSLTYKWMVSSGKAYAYILNSVRGRVGAVDAVLAVAFVCCILFYLFALLPFLRQLSVYQSGVKLMLTSLPDEILNTIPEIREHYDPEAGTKSDQLKKRVLQSEKLLQNILPPNISRRLKNGERVIADTHPNVTAMFATLVGFDEYSQQMDVREVLLFLNSLIVAFDHIVDVLDLEKIKTIGETYFLCGGLTKKTSRDHPLRCVECALFFMEALEDHNVRYNTPNIRLRVGINTGPAVAGVIGNKKVAYDIWGDSVNTASRMMSTGRTGCVQISDSTYQSVSQYYHFMERKVQAKGKGTLTAYIYEGRLKPTPYTDLNWRMAD